jgi:hypothetical protein
MSNPQVLGCYLGRLLSFSTLMNMPCLVPAFFLLDDIPNFSFAYYMLPMTKAPS